jgi:hypothetical protein
MTTKILLVLVAVFFTSTLYLLYLNFSTPKLQLSFTPKTGNLIIPTPAPESNWKTYENKQFGFSLKYPNTWKTNSTSAENIFNIIEFLLQDNSKNTGIYISYSNNPKKLSIPDYYHYFTSNSDMVITDPFNSESKPEKIIIDNHEAYRIGMVGAVPTETIAIRISDEKILNIHRNIYDISSDEYKNIFNQIISTFKSTNLN